MQNPDFSLFNDNMFQKTRSLIENISHVAGMSEINMSIGEPQQDPPAFISKMFTQNKCDWSSYPKVKGNKKFYDDVKYYLNNRFNKIDFNFRFFIKFHVKRENITVKNR